MPGASFVKSAADVMAEKQRLLDEKRATVVMPTPKAKELNNTNNAPVPAPRFMMAPKVAKMPLIGFKNHWPHVKLRAKLCPNPSKNITKQKLWSSSRP